jgi:hypothetical protein
VGRGRKRKTGTKQSRKGKTKALTAPVVVNGKNITGLLQFKNFCAEARQKSNKPLNSKQLGEKYQKISGRKRSTYLYK